MHMTRTSSLASVALISALALSACGDNEDDGEAAEDMEIGSVDLAAAGCPDPLRLQTDWNPQAEHGHLYKMLDGGDYELDDQELSATGPLMASGEYTGIDVTVLAGGPAVGYTAPNAQMYQDDSIFMGYVDSGELVDHVEELQTVAVYAPLQMSPQMIQWDPETYPDVESIADLGETNDDNGNLVTVRVNDGATYVDYLVGAGILQEEQIDPTYDSTPAVFVSEQGQIAQQGFASAEPFIYENDVEEWGRPVEWELVNEAGYPIYQALMATRPENIEEYADCLEELVPVMQQAGVDFYADPDSTIDLILEAVDVYDTGWVYGEEVAEYSLETQQEAGIVGNGPEGVNGLIEPERIEEMIEITEEHLSGGSFPEDMSADDLFTNEFVDESISFDE